MFEIAGVADRWYDVNAEYFKVKTVGGKIYLLRCDTQTAEWTLQSAFDGAGLLARPGVEVIAVDPATIRRAEAQIAGCEQCREENAEIPFDWILADVLGKHGAFEFVLREPGRCPNCKTELSEKTLVEPQGGIEIDVGP